MTVKNAKGGGKPEYIRLPRSGESCPFCHLSRSALDAVTRPQESNNFKPPVASKILKQPNTRRGIRLINYASLMAYLDGLSSNPDDNKKDAVTAPAPQQEDIDKADEPEKVQVMFRFRREFLKRIDAAADKSEVPRQAWVRSIIAKELEAKGL
jgi:hypothetical protein